MIIGGLQKFSLLDYPDQIAAIVFTQGCNFRCQFCYNPMLVWPMSKQKKSDEPTNKEKTKKTKKGHSLLSENDLFRFLKNRTGKLDAIVITGGEPTIHKDLPEFIKKIRKMGFKIKLDTNGTNPEMIKKLIKEKAVDYIAMDIKTSFANYKKATGVDIDLKNIKKAIIIIKESKVPHEFRTTVVPSLVDKKDIDSIGKMIEKAEKWYLQEFKQDKDLVNEEFKKIKPITKKELTEMKKTAQKYVKICELR